jgi:hypothetical protein
LDGHHSLTPDDKTNRGRFRALFWLAWIALGTALGVSLCQSRRPPPEAASEPTATRETEPAALPSPAATPMRAAPTAVAPALEPSDSEPPEPVHPHPITPKRIHIQRENQILQALNDAMDLNDGARLRQILNQYREEFPDDPNQLQEGYQIIANCLEHPGPDSTNVGHRYYDEERGSILRLFVARHCWEEQD